MLAGPKRKTQEVRMPRKQRIVLRKLRPDRQGSCASRALFMIAGRTLMAMRAHDCGLPRPCESDSHTNPTGEKKGNHHGEHLL
jgi:hypothetical protein